MINIAVLTTTRAEYGLMRQLIFKLNCDNRFRLNLLVTGTHLSKKFGMTIDEIEKDGVPIAESIEILRENNENIDVSETMSTAITKFSRLFATKNYDCLLVDGDRYETAAVCIAAVNNRLPIIHCGGGATTEGATDEYWRHVITKLSYLHFPSMEKYRKRILQMGECPDRVFTVGSLGLDNILLIDYMNREKIEKQIQFELNKPFALVTFHPVTMEKHTGEYQIRELLDACDRISDMKFVFTKSNADEDGVLINNIIENYVSSNSQKAVCVASLGAKCYLSAMKICEFVIGNSSSGLIEAPSFHIPTINIGDRQKGREQATSIINCAPRSGDIIEAIKVARSDNFKKICSETINPNGDGKASDRVLNRIVEVFGKDGLRKQKKFYDYE